MIAMPAVDLRDGACVQLVGGAYDAERVRIDDPVAAAARWSCLGFRHLHVVDLDAATSRGSNTAVVHALSREPGREVQVGGGVRSRAAVERVLAGGAARAVVGTRALEDRAWLDSVATEFPGRIVVAADTVERRVVTRGWQRMLGRDLVEVIEELDGLPLAAILVTAVHREGRLAGPDLPLMEVVASRASVPLQASGGITSIADLRALARVGVAAAVIGMALYTGALDGRATAEEFGA